MSNTNKQVINDRYEILERIGRGGMADVFLAHDLLLDRNVAVKVLFPEHAVDPNFVERFRREAQAVAGLNHPNIVGVYDWGQNGNTYFMAMEYVQGRTLSDALRRHGPMSPRDAVNVALAISGALAYAHRNNVVHRDIKPANILMANDGGIKVVDFGIARALDAGHDAGLTQDGAVMGTATYFSPEQAKGEGLDLRSDLYSLGIVLYELLTGRPPFSGESALATAYMQVNQTPERLRTINPNIPNALEAIVSKCMAKDATLRYRTAEALRDDLNRFLNGQPTLAMDEARVRAGKPPLAATNLDEATTVMAPVAPPAASTSSATRASDVTPPTGTQHTAVMPTAMQPIETLPNYDDDAPTKRGYIIGAVVAGVVVLAGIAFLIATMGGDSGVAVPSVKGKTCDVAKTELETAKFVVALNPVETVCDATQTVANQSPAGGDTAASGDTITLVFAAPKVDVPALLGLTEDAARTQVESLGFVFVKGADVINPTYAKGQVAMQNPAGKTQLEKGGTITVNLSGGTGQVAIPAIVAGQTTTAAQTFLQGEPYKFAVTVAEEASATVPKGIVVRTDPIGGTLVDPGAAITVYVSSGPQPVAMPSVKGLLEAEAIAKLTAVGLTAEIEYVNLAAGDVNIGKVISQGTAAGAMVTPDTKVVLTIGRATPVG